MKKLFTKCTAFIFCSIFIAQAAVGQSIWSTDSLSIWNTVLSKKVGIGTTDPENSENWDRVLEITGNIHSKALVSSSNVKSGIWSHNVGYYDAPAGGITGTWSNHPFSIMTNRSARLTVSASGNVGIGTISPNSKLEIINTSTLTYPLIGTAYGALHIVPKAGSAANSSAAITFGAAELVNGSQAGIYVQSSGAYGTKMYFGTTNSYATGTQSRMMIDHNGNVGIGTTNPTQKLSVNGTIQAKEILVNTGWSDFVFDNNYKLRSLTEVEQFVKTNKHLPEIPSQKEVEKNGVQLGGISSKLLMKIEELTLYMIEMKKENEKQKAINIKLENQIKKLKNN